MFSGLTAFQRLRNITGIFTIDEVDKWLVCDKEKQGRELPAKEAEESSFLGTAGLLLSCYGCYHYNPLFSQK